ncbi:MAG: NAD(P)/FAD-dependent oxidoreductase [Alphaproteobacteria bacterium]|nr:NAD(P)/FAD-dependent oxidoreductase [Alphaproteobacteria bacterium]
MSDFDSEYDIVIAGAGVNGLACACLLAKEGLRVCVIERNKEVGGGAITKEVTKPGFKHDLFGSSHVWIQLNKDFKKHIEPELARYGFKYIYPQDHITGHPDKQGGPGIVIYKDIAKTSAAIAHYSQKDADRYCEIYNEFGLIKEAVVKNFFSPPAPPSTLSRAMENSHEGLRRLQDFSLSAQSWVEYNFENDFVKAVMLYWALAPQILPEQEGAGQSFYVMIPAIHDFGQGIPQGGSQELPNCMVKFLESHGHSVLTEETVDEFLIEGGEVIGIQLKKGKKIKAKRAVVSGLDPKQTFLQCMQKDHLDRPFVDMVNHYSFGKITVIRQHLALSEPPEYINGLDMNQCAFHRLVDSTAQIRKFYAEIATGIPPTDPPLWVACWTLLDPSRAPNGQHTLIYDTFVSNWLADGRTWGNIKQEYIQTILLPKLQQYAPNITEKTILGDYIETGESLERANLSFVDGTTNGGERIVAQLGAFRPFPGYAHYRSPIRNLYMTGPHCHPGNGISAMGTITARVMLDDMGIRKADF